MSVCVQNLVATATCSPRFVHPCTYERLSGYQYYYIGEEMKTRSDSGNAWCQFRNILSSSQLCENIHMRISRAVILYILFFMGVEHAFCPKQKEIRIFRVKTVIFTVTAVRTSNLVY
jgi:hypothetical protein